MLRRTKYPPLPEHPQTHTSPTLHTLPSALSPPPTRLERRRDESAGKSGSLNCKLQRRQNVGQRDEEAGRVEAADEYYPPCKESVRPQRIERSGRGSR